MAIASDYRPQKFSDVVGQESVVAALKSIAKADGVTVRSILLYGSWGSGKTTLARIFGKAVNCENFKKTGDVCNECEGCKEAMKKNSQSYIEFDSTRTGSVEAIRNMDSIFSAGVNGRRVLVFDEIHCFHYSNNVYVWDENRRTFYLRKIGQIVSKKEKLEVMCFDNDGNLCHAPIVDWHQNPKRFLRGYHFKSEGFSKKLLSIRCTDDHKIFSLERGWVKAEDLKVGEKVRAITPFRGKDRIKTLENKRRYYLFSKEVEQFLLGTLLGDSSVYAEPGHKPRIVIKQSLKQEFYFKEKARILKGALSYTKLEENKGFGDYVWVGYTRSREQYKKYFELTTKNGKKTVNLEWLSKIEPLGLAAWFMDDGSASYKDTVTKGRILQTVSLATHGFSKEENELICFWFKDKYDLNFKLQLDSSKNLYYIRTSRGEDARKFVEIVAPFILKEFAYKIQGYEAGDGLRKVSSVEIVDYNHLGAVEVSASFVRKDTNEAALKYNDRGHVYDIEVEGHHNYIVQGVSVHNCSSKSAQSALLKVLEEGVKSTFMVFCTTDKVLDTIQSRSVVFNINTIPVFQIKQRVSQIAQIRGIEISDNELEALAIKSKGHMRDALSILEHYELAGSVALKTPLRSLKKFILLSLKHEDIEDVLKDILSYPLVDIRSSVSVMIRDFYRSDEKFDKKVRELKLHHKIFEYFYSSLAQQALQDEYGTEILLRSFYEKIQK